MKAKDLEILEKRIRVLEARLKGINENYSCYHEINQELASLKRIRDFVKSHLSQ